jgi:hypothetical protein
MGFQRQYPHSCQVPGCTANLARQPRYNTRCRICRTHQLAAMIKTDIGIMRYCQQCTRLHSVISFSGNNRSCSSSLSTRRHGGSTICQPRDATGTFAGLHKPNVFCQFSYSTSANDVISGGQSAGETCTSHHDDVIHGGLI